MPKKARRPKKVNGVFGKSWEQIYFQKLKINGEEEILPRIVVNIPLSVVVGDIDPKKIGIEFDTSELTQLPHLLRETYLGSRVKEVWSSDFDKETLELWEKHGFNIKPRRLTKIKVVEEFYHTIADIILNLRIPIRTFYEEEFYEEDPYSEEGYEYLQELEDDENYGY